MKTEDSPKLSDHEFGQLRTLVEDRIGIAVDDGKSYLIESRFSSILKRAGLRSYSELYSQAASAGSNSSIMDEIVNAITTNETLWFRDDGPWEILRESLLPRFVSDLRSGKRNKIRIWSAACSTGQEPYTAAIVIREWIEDQGLVDIKPEAFEIVATDISPHVIEIAKEGVYDQMAASRGLPPQYLERFFSTNGSSISVSPEVRSMVNIKKFNLKDSFLSMGRLNLILCRNVLIYFSQDLKLEILRKMSSSLEEKGSLILGGSESINGAMDLFETVRSGRHLYYSRE